MSEIGHNKPPEMLETAKEVARSISEYMADNPIVPDEESARKMKLQVDRAKLCLKDLDDERDSKVRPLNEQVSAINSEYRAPRNVLTSLGTEMLGRIQVFVQAEEAKRAEIFRELERRAAEAELAAKEAERIERERLDDASKGEIGIDVAEVIANADEAFDEFTKAKREAILAQKETHVKIGGGFTRAISLREKETLHVEQPFVAIMMLGITPDIEAAILKSARAWRKINGKLPDGIISTVEKHM